MQQSAVGDAEVAVAFGGRDDVAKRRPFLGQDTAHVAGDPRDLAAAGVGDAEQHHLADPFGVALRVGQSQGGAPGRAEHQPAVHGQVLAQGFDVAQQVMGGVGAQVDVGLTGVRGAAAGAALVERDDAVAGRVEEAAPERPGTGTGAAVQHHGGFAVGVSADLPADAVAVADVEHAGVVRFGGGMAVGHARTLTALLYFQP
nr:hypothetical protein [Stackebrandtia nassauensis]